jgi:hypothetical protein
MTNTITQQTGKNLGLKGNITKQIFNLYFIEKKDYSEISKILNKDIHYITNIISRLNNRIEVLNNSNKEGLKEGYNHTPTPTQDRTQDNTPTPTQDNTNTKNHLITNIEQDLNKFIPNFCETYFSRKIEDSTDLEILKNQYEYNQQDNKRKYNLLIEGETQTGKTHLIKYFCYKNKIPYIRLNCNGNTTISDLVGGFVNGGVFCYGYLSLALKYGGFLVIDEINLANSEILSGLNSVFDNDRTLIIQETGEKIKAHKDFFIAITLNPANYEGRKILSEDFKARFYKMTFDYDLKLTHEKNLIKNKALIPFIENLRLLRINGEINKPLPITLFMDLERDLEVFKSERVAISNFLYNFNDEQKKSIKNSYEIFIKKSQEKTAQDLLNKAQGKI